MKQLFQVSGYIILLVLSACQTMPMTEDIPAVIIHPNEASRAELKGLVSAALNGADVLLSKSAFTDSNILVIERKKHQFLGSSPILGRDLSVPDVFRLFLSGQQCVLVQERPQDSSSAKRWIMKDTQCEAL